MVDRERTRRTFFYEIWRSGTSGVLETAGTTFLLLIVVRFYEAGSVAKALVAGSGSLGLLLTPLVVSMVTASGWRTSRAAALILAAGATSFICAAAAPQLPIYVICSVISMTASSAIIPLLTQMYQENYPASERGRLFSRTVMIRIATAAIFAKVAGDVLTENFNHFPFLLFTFAAALAVASFCMSRCPTRPLVSDGGAHPLRALRFAKIDPVFRRTLISWMIMGFANLMMLPLRVEYLANPVYGWKTSAALVALLTAVVPNIARLIFSPIWGYLFDHMNFFTLRIILNVGFALGILFFFISQSMTGIVVGAIIFGIANAGGEVAWSLWVTKFAPPARVADYMSVHTFLTGVRGVLAPLTAFLLIAHVSLGSMALVSSIMIAVGTLILVPEIKHGGSSRKASALVEEVSE